MYESQVENKSEGELKCIKRQLSEHVILDFQKLSQMSHSKNTAPKLSKRHKLIIIRLLAAFESVKDIVNHLKVHYDQTVTERLIYWYEENRQEEIEKEREELNNQLQAIPIANKFKRLQIRDKLLNMLMKNLENNIGKEGKDPLIINRILDSVHKEMEPFETTVTEQLGSLPLVEKPEYKVVTNFLRTLSGEEFTKFSKITTRKSVLEELAKTKGEFKEFLKEIENKRRNMKLHEGTL